MDFRDSLGNARPVTAIVGPNTSGKTTILDAISLALGPPTRMFRPRPGLDLSTRTIVRRTALHAKVEATLRFDLDEIATAKRLLRNAGEEPGDEPHTGQDVTIKWSYPDNRQGSIGNHNSRHLWLLATRKLAGRLMATGRATVSEFDKAGGVFFFDQQRQGLGKTISPAVWQVLHGTEAHPNDERFTNDAKTILLDAAVKSSLPAADGSSASANSDFDEIKRAYAALCAPHEVVGAVRDDLGDIDVMFRNNGHEYRYDGLSSGQQMVLLFLIKMVTEHVHRSIVLIDEVELHLHPTWQRKLVDMLPKIGKSNQFIVTTHSDYLLRALPSDAIKEIGPL